MYSKVVPTGDFSKSQCRETTVISIVSIVSIKTWSLQVISLSPSVGKLLWYLLCLLYVFKGGPYRWFLQVPVLGNYCDIYCVYCMYSKVVPTGDFSKSQCWKTTVIYIVSIVCIQRWSLQVISLSPSVGKLLWYLLCLLYVLKRGPYRWFLEVPVLGNYCDIFYVPVLGNYWDIYCGYCMYSKVVPTDDFSKSQCWETTVISIVSIVGIQRWSLQVISLSPSVGKLLWYILCLLYVFKGGPYRWFLPVTVLGNYCDIYCVYRMYSKVVPTGDFSVPVLGNYCDIYCVYWMYSKVVPAGDFSKSECWETTVISIVSIECIQRWSLQVISLSPSVGKLLWYLLWLLYVFKGGPYR